MPGTERAKLTLGRARRAAPVLLALLAAACSSTPERTEDMRGFGGAVPLSDFFSGASAKAPQTAAGAQPDVNCPRVEVRQGASTLTIGAPENKSAMTLRYQGEFTRQARDCAVVDGNMVMRVGVQGRLVVGPTGGPGQVDVPLRIAIVQETPGGMRPIATKFIRIPVVVTNEQSALFSHIESGLTFPLPVPVSALDDYIAYVGFDPLSAQAQDQQLAKEPPRHKRKKPPPRPGPGASAN